MGPNVTFYRSHDGALSVGHIDGSVLLFEDQSRGAAPHRTHVVTVGPISIPLVPCG